MDYENKIELPFGAFDSELYYKEIIIPEGLEAIMEDGKIILRKKETEDERIKKAIIIYLDWLDGYKDYRPKGKFNIRDMIDWIKKQDNKEPKPTLPKWKYKKDNTPLLKDSIILNKYGCVAKSPSGAIVSDVWILDYDELAKLPKEKPEKQDKQNPIDKVEPRFHEGDWVVQGCNILKIRCVGDEYCCFETVGGYVDDMLVSEINSLYHLWTIKDAKEGDVLEFGDHGRLVTGILSFVNKTTGKVDVSCLLEGDKLKVGVFYNLDTVKPHPATKSQRDILFQKLKEAGWEWDAEAKKLNKKLEAFPILSNSTKTGKKWTEEDAKAIDNCCLLIGAADECYEKAFKDDCIHYLQNLKQRIEQ